MVTPLFTSIPRTPRLINRERELESIRRAIYEAEAGSCQIILLQAAGGLGKSRLAEEAWEKFLQSWIGDLATLARLFLLICSTWPIQVIMRA
jgi:hypothetical protein